MLSRFVSLEVLGASQVDQDDRTYAITPRWFPLDKLSASIRKSGIINPLHVEPVDGGRHRIVCGFRRAQAATEAGIENLPCWVRRKSARSELFAESILDNIGSRSLHELEKASAVAKLVQNFRISRQRVLEEFLPLFEVRPTPFYLQRYLDIDCLPEQLKRATVESRLELDTALAMADWTETEQQTFLGLHSRYKLNVNAQKKLTEVLDELRRKTGLSATEIWRQAVDERQPGSGQAPGVEFEQAFRSLLRLRMPRLSALEDQYRELKAALRLPPEVRLQPPAYFEGDRLTVSFSASNAREFREAAERLRSAAQSPEMEEIFALL
jgi:ParB-like chromosome segregation protein Spo0J